MNTCHMTEDSVNPRSSALKCHPHGKQLHCTHIMSSKLTTLVRLGAWSAGSRAASAASSRRAMMTCSTICAAFRFTLQRKRMSAFGCNATSATEDREAIFSKVQRLCNQIGRIGMLT